MHSFFPKIGNNTTANKVLMDQVMALESGLAGGSIATINLSLLGVWFCRNNANHDWIFGWLFVKILINLWIIWADFRQRKIPMDEANVLPRLRKIIAMTIVNGLLWMIGIALMWMPDNFELQLLLIVLTLSLGSGGLLELKAFLPALFLMTMPTMASVIIATLWHSDQHSLLVVLMIMAFIVWGIGHGRKEHRKLIDALYKHYEVAELTVKLQTQIEIAHSATEAKSRFLAAASHDLRQPMHTLNLYLGALANFNLPTAALPVLAKVRECAHRMDEMFAALLDISRLDASVLQANFNVFPIATVLSKVHLEFSHQAEAKGLILRVAPCSVMIKSDVELLENILRNLVSNALRYTKQGKILIGCRRTNKGIKIGVYDTGIGIAAEQQAVIFEEFFQVGNHERDRSQGLGLGLAIAQRQAHLIQAPITLRSESGSGSVFEIEITRSALPPNTQPIIQTLRQNDQDLTGTLIVVVDDEVLILDATRLLLEQWGCSVITASSGPEMLHILANSLRAPDVIISDHRLRNDETGIQVIDSIRNEFSRDIPAVLITGDTSPEQIKEITAAKLPVLHKPLQSQVLREMLLNLIAEYDAIEE